MHKSGLINAFETNTSLIIERTVQISTKSERRLFKNVIAQIQCLGGAEAGFRAIAVTGIRPPSIIDASRRPPYVCGS